MVGIPNSVSDHTFGSRTVAYYLRVTLTLTSGLSSRRIVHISYIILLRVGITNLVCGYILGSPSVMFYFGVTVTLTYGLRSRKNVLGAAGL